MDAYVRRHSEENMIVGPNKGLFFMATALMCSASLYGAELSGPSSNPLTRIFVGEPNRLTLPPDFPEAAAVPPDEDDASCTPDVAERGLAGATRHVASASSEPCRSDDKPALGAIVLPGRLSTLAPDAPAKVEASVGAAAQAH
jgi:hypothetical protein